MPAFGAERLGSAAAIGNRSPGNIDCFTVGKMEISANRFEMQLGEPSFEDGVLLGILIGEGHFGGDRKQPHITIKMHVRHERLLVWLLNQWPMGRLYGPYDHSGRHYFQLMYRGAALTARLIPFLDALPWAQIDGHTHARYTAMKERYDLT